MATEPIGRSRPGWSFPVFLTACLLLMSFAALLGAGGSSPDAQPLPFDPLSPNEHDQAVATTLADPLIERSLSDHHEVIGAALNTDKHRLRQDPASRVADVWIYDYQSDHVVYAQVDLKAGNVASFVITTDYQPPITVGEIVRAGELALDDERVQEQLDTMRPYEEMETMARLWTGDAPTACSVHRCALVALLPDGEYQGDVFVRVNLSLQSVEEILRGDPHGHILQLEAIA